MQVNKQINEEIKQTVLNKYTGGEYDVRTTCPHCSPRRKKVNQNDRCLSSRVYPNRIVYNCHHCGEQGVVPLKEFQPRERPTGDARPKPIQATGETTPGVIAYLGSRKISEDVCRRYNIFQAKKWFRKSQRELDAVGFPYQEGGNVYAVKYRPLKEKDFTQEGAACTFFGIEQVENDGSALIITEGEIDALSAVEGYHQQGIKANAVSVPSGAPLEVKSEDFNPQEDRKYRYVWNAAEMLDDWSKIILAVDDDPQGEALAEELARRIGKDKCWKVEYPEGCKDLNDVLVKYDGSAVVDVLESATPWPVAGLYDATHYEAKVMDMYHNGLAQGLSTGLPSVDDLFTILPGQLSVWTGVPSSGKSEFLDQVLVNLAEEHGWTFAICSFENDPEFHIRKLLEKRIGKPFGDGETSRMSEQELREGLAWVKDHFLFIDQSDGNAATLDSVLERSKAAVRRMGCRGVVIDPFNYLVAPSGQKFDTDAISDMLTQLRMFAKGFEVHVWMVAHPQKLYRQDGKTPVPTGYDIAGSGHWFNKADIGVTVHRNEDSGVVEVHCWKVRFKWIGSRGQVALNYDLATGRYSDCYDFDRAMDDLEAMPPAFMNMA
jgi:twinkle protein